MRIGVTEIAVDDQEKAREFYSGVLGLRVKVDAQYGPDARWLSVVSPEDPDGTELLLGPLDETAARLQAARRERGTPTLSFSTDDCRRSYEELKARGAVFRSAPQERPYGGTDAVFEDGCGNLLNLHEAEASGAEPSVFAGVAVSDVDAVLPWYEKLFGRPADARPMAGLADYRFAGGAVVQLVADAERAGRSLLTLSFDDLERACSAMRERGLETGPVDDTTSDKVLIAAVSDPDGNAVTLVQQR
jgi:catechol 2,3-dioxygenase-like lactoylglutathione lyase family enzyme